MIGACGQGWSLLQNVSEALALVMLGESQLPVSGMQIVRC